MTCDTAKGIRLQQHGKKPTWTYYDSIWFCLYSSLAIYYYLLILYYWLSDNILTLYCGSFLFICCSNNHHGYQFSRFNWTWSSCIPTSSLRGPPTTKIYSTDFSVPTFSTAGFFHTSKICFWETPRSSLTYWWFLFPQTARHHISLHWISCFRSSGHWPVLRHREQSCRSSAKVHQVSRRKKRSNFCTSCGGHRRMSFTQFWSLYCLPYKTPIQNAMLHHVCLTCPQSIKETLPFYWPLVPATSISVFTCNSPLIFGSRIVPGSPIGHSQSHMRILMVHEAVGVFHLEQT